MTLERIAELRALFDSNRIWTIETGELNNIIEECVNEIESLMSWQRNVAAIHGIWACSGTPAKTAAEHALREIGALVADVIERAGGVK